MLITVIVPAHPGTSFRIIFSTTIHSPWPFSKLDKWSKKQADKYYEILLENCQYIADDPYIGKNYDGIKNGLLGLKGNRHTIFYRKFNDKTI